MDSKDYPEYLGEHGHGIAMESGEKSRFDHPPRQPEHQRRQRKLASVRIILVTALVLGLVGLGVSVPKSTTLWWRMPCHVGVVAEQDPSTMEAASAEALQDSLPGRHQHEAVDADNDLAGPVASSFRRLLRRQDNNSTTSSAPPPTTSASTTIPPSSTTTPPPTTSTRSTTSSTSTSSPPPPPPPSSTTTPPPPPPTTTSASSPPPPPPSSPPQLTTIPGTSSDPVSNNRTPTPSTSIPLVSSGNGNAGGGATPTPSPTPAPSPSVPSTIDGGTILTRLTTLERTGGSTIVEEVPVTIPARTSRVVLETLISTKPNGDVVVVTQTSYVPADPAMTGDPYTANEPSLHNGAPGKGLGGVAVGVVVGVLLGVALV